MHYWFFTILNLYVHTPGSTHLVAHTWLHTPGCTHLVATLQSLPIYLSHKRQTTHLKYNWPLKQTKISQFSKSLANRAIFELQLSFLPFWNWHGILVSNLFSICNFRRPLTSKRTNSCMHTVMLLSSWNPVIYNFRTKLR